MAFFVDPKLTCVKISQAVSATRLLFIYVRFMFVTEANVNRGASTVNGADARLQESYARVLKMHN